MYTRKRKGDGVGVSSADTVECSTFVAVFQQDMVCLFIVVLRPSLSGRVPTCDSAYSWRVYSAASLGHQAAGIMICYPTQSHYLDTEPTSPCDILKMMSARLGSDKYKFKSHWFDLTRV